MKPIFFLALSFILFAQEHAAGKSCADYRGLKDSAVVEAGSDCDSVSYYYGFAGKSGDAEALKCAYRELKNPEIVFGGAAILMMMYANGRGVKKDIDLALKYACLQPGSAEETSARIGHLNKLRNAEETFDFCDDVKTDRMIKRCERVRAQPSREKRNARAQALMKNWTPADHENFRALRKTFRTFQDEHVSKEVDLSSGSSFRKMMDERDVLEESFLLKLERFERGEFPAETADNTPAMGQAFRIIQGSKHPRGTVSAKGCQETQVAWLKYVDGWIAFSRARYPKLVPVNLVRELTGDRLVQLEKVRSGLSH